MRELFAGIAGRYDLANHTLSAGLDFGWRRMTARLVAERLPRRILDLATGSGDLAIELRRRNPGAVVVGADFCVPMMREALRKGFGVLVAADGLALPFRDGSFDAVTVAFGLRNMADWARAMREASRVLSPGGTYAVLDFSLPDSWLRPLYRFYLHRLLPVAAGLLTGQRAAYEYLGRSIESFPSGGAMAAMLKSNGFAEVAVRPMACGVVTLYLARKSERLPVER